MLSCAKTSAIGPKSVGDALYILNSDGCGAASWYLRDICNSGLAIETSVALGVFTTDYGAQDPGIGVHM